jgi:hypothetical protein
MTTNIFRRLKRVNVKETETAGNAVISCDKKWGYINSHLPPQK